MDRHHLRAIVEAGRQLQSLLGSYRGVLADFVERQNAVAGEGPVQGREGLAQPGGRGGVDQPLALA